MLSGCFVHFRIVFRPDLLFSKRKYFGQSEHEICCCCKLRGIPSLFSWSWDKKTAPTIEKHQLIEQLAYTSFHSPLLSLALLFSIGQWTQSAHNPLQTLPIYLAAAAFHLTPYLRLFVCLQKSVIQSEVETEKKKKMAHQKLLCVYALVPRIVNYRRLFAEQLQIVHVDSQNEEKSGATNCILCTLNSIKNVLKCLRCFYGGPLALEAVDIFYGRIDA